MLHKILFHVVKVRTLGLFTCVESCFEIEVYKNKASSLTFSLKLFDVFKGNLNGVLAILIKDSFYSLKASLEMKSPFADYVIITIDYFGRLETLQLVAFLCSLTLWFKLSRHLYYSRKGC